MWNSEDICVWLQMTKYTDTHSMVANLQNSPVLYDDIKIRFFSTAVSRTETYDLHMFDCHIFVVQNCWNIFNAWYTYMWVDFTWCFFFSFYRKTFLKYMTIVHSSSGFIPILFKTTGKFSWRFTRILHYKLNSICW